MKKKKPDANTPVDVVGDAEACRLKFMACIRKAGPNPVKQQICLTNYMACLLTTSAKLSGGMDDAADGTEEQPAE